MTVQAALDVFLDEGLQRAHGHGPHARDLWGALRQATTDGKRFRPALLLAAYRASGGKQDALAERVAAAVELLHTAFVVHDDVIDGDLTRRGAANVSGVFVHKGIRHGADDDNARTLGMAAGVLAGDLALAGAITAIALCGADMATTRRLLELTRRAIEVTAIGELADVMLSVCTAEDAALAEAITMEEQKTAVYSFQLPMQLGAVLAGSNDAAVERLGEVGRLAGIGFQHDDDLNGVIGEESRTGKSNVGDLREGKMTPLMIHARSTTSWPGIAAHLGDRTLDADQASAVRLLLEQCGSRAFIERLAESYVNASLSAAEELSAEPDLLLELSALTRQILASAA